MTLFSQSGQKIVDELNDKYTPPKLLSDKRLTFGEPSALTDDPDGFNTEVLATSVPGMGYYGDQMIKYMRVPLALLAGVVNLADTNPFTVATICAQLNAQFGTFLDPTDLSTQDSDIPPLSQGNFETITLTADPNSLGWTGSVDIVITYGYPFLDAVIHPKTLGVRTDNIQKPYGYQSGRLALWNTDFTSFRDAMKITPRVYDYFISNGKYYPEYFSGLADFGALRAVCLKLGFADFTAPNYQYPARDYATSAVATSNPAFDRVMILGPIQWGRYYLSNMYFHYNNLESR